MTDIIRGDVLDHLYVVEYTDLDCNEYTDSWLGADPRCYSSELMPLSTPGLRIERDGKKLLIPWHQVKQASLSATKRHDAKK
jgi:hypothetical protein